MKRSDRIKCCSTEQTDRELADLFDLRDAAATASDCVHRMPQNGDVTASRVTPTHPEFSHYTATAGGRDPQKLCMDETQSVC